MHINFLHFELLVQARVQKLLPLSQSLWAFLWLLNCRAKLFSCLEPYLWMRIQITLAPPALSCIYSCISMFLIHTYSFHIGAVPSVAGRGVSPSWLISSVPPHSKERYTLSKKQNKKQKQKAKKNTRNTTTTRWIANTASHPHPHPYPHTLQPDRKPLIFRHWGAVPAFVG